MPPATAVIPDSGRLPTSLAIATQIYKIAAEGQDSLAGGRARAKDHNGEVVAIIVCVVLFLVLLPLLVYLMCAYFEKGKRLHDDDASSMSRIGTATGTALPTLETTLPSLYAPQPPPSRVSAASRVSSGEMRARYPSLGRLIHPGYTTDPPIVSDHPARRHQPNGQRRASQNSEKNAEPNTFTETVSDKATTDTTEATVNHMSTVPRTTFILDGQSALHHEPAPGTSSPDANESVSDGTQPESVAFGPPSYHTNDVSDEGSHDNTPQYSSPAEAEDAAAKGAGTEYTDRTEDADLTEHAAGAKNSS